MNANTSWQGQANVISRVVPGPVVGPAVHPFVAFNPISIDVGGDINLGEARSSHNQRGCWVAVLAQASEIRKCIGHTLPGCRAGEKIWD